MFRSRSKIRSIGGRYLQVGHLLPSLLAQVPQQEWPFLHSLGAWRRLTWARCRSGLPGELQVQVTVGLRCNF